MRAAGMPRPAYRPELCRYKAITLCLHGFGSFQQAGVQRRQNGAGYPFDVGVRHWRLIMPFSPCRHSFDPGTLTLLGKALDAAWQKKQASRSDDAHDYEARHRLAKLVVRRAQSGGYDQNVLIDYALSNFQARSTRGSREQRRCTIQSRSRESERWLARLAHWHDRR